MANLGNVGHNVPLVRSQNTAWGFYTQDKQPTSVDMANTATPGTPFAFAILTRNGTPNYRTRADGSGIWHFYDMDNSGSQVYSIATYTQSGPTGEAWTATVVGTVVTVTQQFSSNRTRSFSFG